MSPRKKTLIFLTGFMGSGKSTITPILANALGYSFIDIDDEIEKVAGKRIVDIFSDWGEERFRHIEQQLLNEASQLNECVISLGGGTVADETNLALVKSSGILVYLTANVEQLVHRLRNKTDRPLLKSIDGTPVDGENLQRRVAALLSIRAPYYGQADISSERIRTRLDTRSMKSSARFTR